MLNSNYSIIPKQINQDNNLDSMSFGITKDQYYFIISFNVNSELKFSKNCTWAYRAINDPNSQPKLLTEINSAELSKTFNFVLQISDYTLTYSRFVIENQWVDEFLSNFERRTNIQTPIDEEILNILMNIHDGRFYQYLRDSDRESNIVDQKFEKLKKELEDYPINLYDYKAKITVPQSIKTELNIISNVNSSEGDNLLWLMINSGCVVTNSEQTMQIKIADLFTIVDVASNIRENANLELIKLYNTGVLTIYKNILPYINSSIIKEETQLYLDFIESKKSEIVLEKDALTQFYFNPSFSRIVNK